MAWIRSIFYLFTIAYFGNQWSKSKYISIFWNFESSLDGPRSQNSGPNTGLQASKPVSKKANKQASQQESKYLSNKAITTARLHI